MVRSINRYVENRQLKVFYTSLKKDKKNPPLKDEGNLMFASVAYITKILI